MSFYKCLSDCNYKKNDVIMSRETISKMCMSECLQDHEDKYTAPLIWVGFYIAAASLVCMLAMLADLVNGLRMKKPWFPCKYFTLNAAISTLLAIALKMPVDLTTIMPCGRDQLMKLSATAFMSVSMGNFMPSLGDRAMSGLLEISANLMALAVFIFTLISNICIQIGTGVIYRGVAAHHIIIIFCIDIQFTLLVFITIACPPLLQVLDMDYNQQAKSSEKLSNFEELIKKHWIMTQTSIPQFVISRSVICNVSGAICVLTLLVLAHAIFHLYTCMNKFMFFDPSSDYRWSANVIVLVQLTAVIVGSISPISRWLTFLWFKLEMWPKLCSINYLRMVEPYWTHRLKTYLRMWQVFDSEDDATVPKVIMILHIFIKLQIITIISCMFFCLVSSVFLLPFMFVYEIIVTQLVYKIIVTPKNNIDDEASWVLKLDHEPDLPKSTIMKIISVAESRIKKEKKKAESQINLLNNSYGFDGIKEFDKKFIEELTKINIVGVSNNPNGSWAIRIVTLSTIICAIKWEEEFVSTVNAILPLVIYVENALSHGAFDRQTIIDVGYLAMNVWSRVYYSKKWLNKKLPIKINESLDYRNGEALKKILETLRGPSQKKQRDENHVIIEEWMKETAKIVIEFLSSGKLNVEKKIEVQQLHDKMTRMVLDMLVACLVNIERAISANISNASIETRESVVKEAVSIHGKTIEIQKFVKERFSTVKEDHREYLQASWWKFMMPKTPLQYAIRASYWPQSE